MTASRPLRILLLAVVGCALPADDQLAGTAPTPFPWDVIALHGGDRQLGSPDWVVDHGPFRYQFASVARRDAFAADPGRYAPSWGGACARMGPLSSPGRPEFHAVHDGRLYLFASESCRRTFESDPTAYLEWTDVAPTADAAARERGRVWVERARAALGDPAALEGWLHLDLELRRTETHGERTYLVRERLVLARDGRLRDETAWDADVWADVLVGDAAVAVDPDGGRSARTPEQAAILVRRWMRHPLTVLTRCQAPGVQLAHLGTVHQGDRLLQRVAVHADGTSVELWVDAADGHVVQLSHLGRGPSARVGRVVHRYAAFAPVGALVLPHRVRVAFDGEPVERWSGDWRLVLDGPLEAGTLSL